MPKGQGVVSGVESPFEVGQTVWIAYGRREPGDGLIRGVVTKVGRRWVYVRESIRTVSWQQEERFDPSEKTWRDGYPLDGGNYGSPGTVYLDPQVFLDLEEKDWLSKFLSQQFGYYNHSLTLDQLRRIEAIVKEGAAE